MCIKQKNRQSGFFVLYVCAGQDLNLRSPKASDLQSDVIDHSTTDAYRRPKASIGLLYLKVIFCHYAIDSSTFLAETVLLRFFF